MVFGRHVQTFGGLHCVPWSPGDPLPDLTRQLPRLSLRQYDEFIPWSDLLDAYLALPGADRTQGLSVGCWSAEMSTGASAAAAAAALAGAGLPLRVLFFGDVTVEECEVSWMVNTDLAPLLAAHPQLDHLAIRGGHGLRLAGVRLPALQLLTVESGGLRRDTLADVLAADLPALAWLDLYTGDSEFGADSTVEDLAPLLSGQLYPQLQHLGVRDCEYTDDVCRALAASPLLGRLRSLDLSEGTLTDDGARALATAPAVRGLQQLTVRHHFLTETGERVLRETGVPVQLADRQALEDRGPGSRPWVAIGE